MTKDSTVTANLRTIRRSMTLEELVATLRPVLKKELIMFQAARALENLCVLAVKEGYVLTFNLKTVNEPQILIGSRGEPRVWVSLDRLVFFVNENGLGGHTFNLKLNSPALDISVPTPRRTRRKAIP